MKKQFKDQFSAVIKVGNKVSTFPKSADTKEILLKLLSEHGLGVSNLIAVKKFDILVEKQRGRAKSKY